ncbi:MAG: hypothetical protein LBL62_09110 [Planctomycetaceae bacterium]|jgi:hypothetical protein|nr:hypothetical protein [Planctomycetaceae bacterium]
MKARYIYEGEAIDYMSEEAVPAGTVNRGGRKRIIYRNLFSHYFFLAS